MYVLIVFRDLEYNRIQLMLKLHKDIFLRHVSEIKYTQSPEHVFA